MVAVEAVVSVLYVVGGHVVSVTAVEPEVAASTSRVGE